MQNVEEQLVEELGLDPYESPAEEQAQSEVEVNDPAAQEGQPTSAQDQPERKKSIKPKKKNQAELKDKLSAPKKKEGAGGTNMAGRLDQIEHFLDKALCWKEAQSITILGQLMASRKPAIRKQQSSPKGRAKQQELPKKPQSPKKPARSKYIVDTYEGAQDAGVINEAATKKKQDQIDNLKRVKQNPVTVEVLPEFTNLP